MTDRDPTRDRELRRLAMMVITLTDTGDLGAAADLMVDLDQRQLLFVSGTLAGWCAATMSHEDRHTIALELAGDA